MTRRPISLSLLLAALALLLAVTPASPRAPSKPVVSLTIDGAIGPATVDYVSRGLDHARRDGAQLVVLRLDTPGGLDTSMRSIIQAMLASTIPVACHVAPSGARAASAGTFILYASHIAAMAPGTNVGAATPVAISPTAPEGDTMPRDSPSPAMTQKHVNDAVAYVQSLAHMRGRNAAWAELAVRESASLPASDALKMKVIEFVASDTADLLAQLDGRTVAVGDRKVALSTAAAPIVLYAPDWRVKLLTVLTNPSIALILMAIGIYGLLFEFMSPGAIVPGVLGAICLLLGMYALQLLPVNAAGLALILLGLAFMIGEGLLPSYGMLGLGGIAAFVVGALILIDTEVPGFGIPLGLIAAIAVSSALLVVALVSVAMKTRKRAVVSGDASLLGSVGQVQVLDPSMTAGWAQVHGEQWRIVSKVPLQQVQQVRVLSRSGLILEVAPAGNEH